MTTPRNVNYFINNVKLASSTLECQQRLINLNLADANVNDKLQRLRHYNNQYSRVGACRPIINPGINGITANFESRIINSGTTLNSTERVAINNFYETVKSFWSKLYEVYPFVGSALNGAMVPLKATTTTGGVPSASLTNTFYDRTLGILIGESSRFIGFGATSEALRAASAGLGATRLISFTYPGTAESIPIMGNGLESATSSDFFYPRLTTTNNLIADLHSYNPSTDRATIINQTTNNNNTYLITRLNGGVVRVFNEQGLFVSGGTAPATKTLPNLAFEIGRARFLRINAIVDTFQTTLAYRLKFFVSGQGLTNGEATTLMNAVIAFKTALGR